MTAASVSEPGTVLGGAKHFRPAVDPLPPAEI